MIQMMAFTQIMDIWTPGITLWDYLKVYTFSWNLRGDHRDYSFSQVLLRIAPFNGYFFLISGREPPASPNLVSFLCGPFDLN